MKTLNLYILKNFLTTFLMAIGILSFGFAGARLLQVISFLEEGVPILVVLKALYYLMPHLLCFVIPWASLVSIMLVFGRMSTDNEITAMRACGVSILQVVSPLIVFTICLTGLCLYLQLEVAPLTMEKERDIFIDAGVKHPLAFFSAGRSNSSAMSSFMKGASLYFSRKDDNGDIYNVQAYKIENGRILMDATAARGHLQANPKEKKLTVVLYDAIVERMQGNPDDFDSLNKSAISLTMDEFHLDLDYGQMLVQENLIQREKYLPVGDLLARMVVHQKMGQDTTELETELAMRVCMALAPIAFLLLGLPIALTTTNRKESNIGLFIAVLLGGAYVANVLLFDAFRDEKNAYPQYLIWIVPAVFQTGGIILLRALAKK